MSYAPFLAAAYLGGALTLLSPCILPVLPIVLGSADRSLLRWIAPMLAGLVTAFVAAATVGAAGALWVASLANVGRWAALALLAGVGASLLSPRIARVLAAPLVRGGLLMQDGTAPAQRPHAYVVGLATGLLWAPCAGPVLGLVIALVASGAAPASAELLLLAFGAGAATALGAALFAGAKALRALRPLAAVDYAFRRIAGVGTLASVAVMALGWDAALLSRAGLVQTAHAEEVLLRRIASGARADVARAIAQPALAVPTPDYGPLPDFVGGTMWLNDAPVAPLLSGSTLPARALRGKVVVVNVWTFECFNCLNALPYVKALEAKYRGRDVVVIGVHTPELARERVPANVADAVRRLGVTYPIVLDPSYAIWQSLHNEYWPSVYIADRNGRIRFRHFGEGAYADEDRVVAQLLAEQAFAAP